MRYETITINNHPFKFGYLDSSYSQEQIQNQDDHTSLVVKYEPNGNLDEEECLKIFNECNTEIFENVKTIITNNHNQYKYFEVRNQFSRRMSSRREENGFPFVLSFSSFVHTKLK